MKIIIIAALALVVSASAFAQNKTQTTAGGAVQWQDTATYVLKLKLWDLGKIADKVGEHAQLLKSIAVTRNSDQLANDAKVIKEDEQLRDWLTQQLQAQLSRHQLAAEKAGTIKFDPPKK